MKEVGPCWLWSVCRVQISEREVAMAWAEPEGSLEDGTSGRPGGCSKPEADVRVLWGRALPAEK